MFTEYEIRRAHPSDANDIAVAHRDSIRSVGPKFYPANVVEDWGEGLTPDIYVNGGRRFLGGMEPRPAGRGQVRTLLDRGGVRPPYVLVGHSYGGWLVRLYASTYPADVAGMVLVEAGGDDPWRLIGNGPLRHSSELATGKPIPAVQTSNPIHESDIRGTILSQMKAAAQQLAAHPNEPPRDKLPADAQRMRAWALGTVKHIAAGVNPFEAEELAALRAERAKSEHPYGDIPLVVLTRGLTDEGGPDTTVGAEEHRKEHAALAKLSQRPADHRHSQRSPRATR